MSESEEHDQNKISFPALLFLVILKELIQYLVDVLSVT